MPHLPTQLSWVALLALATLTACAITTGASPRVETRTPASEAQATPLEPADYLAPFAPLVGPTWQGEFPGGEMRDLQRFEWALDGRFLRNVHRVVDASGQVLYAGETFYGWDHQQAGLRWWYFNSTGGHIVGELMRDGERWIAEGDNHGPDGQTARVRTVLELGPDGWTSTSYFQRDGAWEQRFRMPFVAVP